MAEDFRQELAGKITAVGFYLGDDIVIRDPIIPNTTGLLPKIAFLTRLMDGDGTWKSNWSIFGPGDVLISKSNKDFDVVKDKDSVHAIITTTALPVAKPGKYKYLLDLGGMKIEYVFNVSFK